TQGKAKKLLTELKNKGAVFVKNQNELLSLLNVSEEKLKIAKEETAKFLDHLKPEQLAKETKIKGKGEKS
ncbi:MAG: hypothetical protein JSW44_03930, partial [Candidatus Bathyarchaeota archaeon]